MDLTKLKADKKYKLVLVNMTAPLIAKKYIGIVPDDTCVFVGDIAKIDGEYGVVLLVDDYMKLEEMTVFKEQNIEIHKIDYVYTTHDVEWDGYEIDETSEEEEEDVQTTESE